MKTIRIYKAVALFLSLSAMAAISSCSSDLDGSDVSDQRSVSLGIKGLPSRGSDSDAPALAIYQFGAEGLVDTNILNDYDPEKVVLKKGSTEKIFCVSGLLPEVPEGVTMQEFSLSRVECSSEGGSARLFLSGSATVASGQNSLQLEMKRGVARIDLDATWSAMEISSVSVIDAAASSYVFESDEALPDPGSVSFTRNFSTAPEGLEKALFLIFENVGETHIEIEGSVNGTPVTLPVAIGKVERNKVYTLRVADSQASVEASFSVAEWEKGDDMAVRPDTSRAMLIDEAESFFPAGVKVDYLRNIIEVPGSGAHGLKVAFRSELRTDIDTVVFRGERVLADSVAEKQVRISAGAPVNSLSGVVTKIDIDVDSQLNGRPEYEFRIYVKKSVMSASYDYVTVRVAQSPKQIPTVRIAGSEWMAFNCTTPDLDDQIYVDEGLTVEDMYVNDWVTCVGGLFQFGRKYKYIPYESYNPSDNLGDQKQDVPWVHYSHMPCPEGYHVPSLEEMNSLFPHGTPIPGTYTAGNGESITVDLVRLPGDVVTPTNVNGVCRYLRFISNDTGNTLILPLAGYKGDKSTAMSCNFGRDGVYWSNSNANCPGGYARAWRFMFNWGDSCEMQDFQFQMEAFAYVRAIKNEN